MKYTFLGLITLLFFSGCASRELIYYEIPYELKETSNMNDFMTRYSPHLWGKKFYIDPGHGGEDRHNTGNLELVIEADINLHVALALRDYLTMAGAEVVLSRDRDATVELRQRSVLANASGADFFISIHHNAPGRDSDDWINYTSTYYHATETDYEYEPSERDLAKYIQRDLAYAMRNSGGLGSFDGTYSDYWIYPKMGFSVLRITEIPAVLVECGFFTNNFEERRLAVNEFNKIEAWGIFRGIARYLAAGIPEIVFLNENDKHHEGDLMLDFFLKDSSGIDTSAFLVQFDSAAVKDISFDSSTGLLHAAMPEVETGEHAIRVIAANKKGNHTLPFHRKITVLPK